MSISVSRILGGVKSLAVGFLMGLGVILLVGMIAFFVVGVVTADESVRTYPARLGEQNRSLNYPTITQEYVTEYHAHISEDSVASLEGSSCAQTNMYLLYMMKDIAKQIAKNPDLGYIYKSALLTIRESWCNG